MMKPTEDFDFPSRYLSNTSLDLTAHETSDQQQQNTQDLDMIHIGQMDRYKTYGPFRLFDLPIEIRNIIYRYAIIVDGRTAIAMRPTSKGYSVQSFMIDELDGMLQTNDGSFVAASGLHDASKKLRAEVTSIYRTAFNLVLPELHTTPWVLRALKNWGAFPYLKDVTLKVFFAPSMFSVRDKRDTLMDYFSDGSNTPHLEALRSCLGLLRVHFDIALADCNQQCQISPIFEDRARRVLGSELMISARTTNCEHCPLTFELRSVKRFAKCKHKREDGNRLGDDTQLVPSSAIERWKWTCAPRSNIWDIARFKFDITTQRFSRVVGLSDIISQYRRDATVDKAAAKEKLQGTAQELRQSVCDTLGCTALARGIPTDPRYARAQCCRFCELAWFCPDHYFIGQHQFRGDHCITGYCIKRPLPAADGMVHMAPVDDISQDRIYDEPRF